jgi:hypothetical protein
MNWTYMDAAGETVARTLDDGRYQSTLASTLPEGTVIAPYVAPPVDVQALIVTATQQRLDDFAKTRNYDGILSACTYAPSLIDRFRIDGVYCIGARDNTWAALYAFMGEVQAGTKPFPTSFADVEPLLPILAWPV